jgi:hypothetical protein
MRHSQRVKAEAAMYTAGFVLMSLIINLPLCAPLITFLGLNKINHEQLIMRGHVSQRRHNTFIGFAAAALPLLPPLHIWFSFHLFTTKFQLRNNERTYSPLT